MVEVGLVWVVVGVGVLRGVDVGVLRGVGVDKRRGRVVVNVGVRLTQRAERTVPAACGGDDVVSGLTGAVHLHRTGSVGGGVKVDVV